MNKEKRELEILQKHSQIIQPDPSYQNNLMAYGLCCGVGWFDIIDASLTEIEKLELPDDFEIFQIKEKMGDLRIYTSGNVSQEVLESIYGILNKAEEEASNTCEKCGSVENVKLQRVHGWYSTICDGCVC